MSESNQEGIAIIGMDARVPGSRNIHELWDNLARGVDSISTFSRDEMAASGVDLSRVKFPPDFQAAGGILEGIDLFDPVAFKMNPRDAEVMDPQIRLFLEACWQCFESAGYDPGHYPGMIAVYAGMHSPNYLFQNVLTRMDVVDSMGSTEALFLNDRDYLATHIAYKLNLKGPAITLSTACSTSLVAVIRACQSLLSYQCDMALAGGVTVLLPEKLGDHFPGIGITSSKGCCRPFDAGGDGTVFSSGLGVVLLKRLPEALDDGDDILAVIKGAAINNDGSDKVSYSAPSVQGQLSVISLAHAMAGISPDTISYVEAHGTGTLLGDPAEISALSQAFRFGTTRRQFCAVGSIKSNIGHLVAAAGVAGLIKTVLALKHKQIPPSLHFVHPNPEIDFASTPFYVNAALTEWKSGPTPRRAGVSSFGVGGTNAHVVLEEAPVSAPSGPSRPWQLLLLSAKTPTALDVMSANLARRLKAEPALSLADVSFTLQVGRKAFNHRRVLVSADCGDGASSLESRDGRRVLTSAGEAHGWQVVFMFPGQGAQYVSMARGLYESEPVFRSAVDECCQLLQPQLGFDLRTILYPAQAPDETLNQQLQRTDNAQPALFVIEYAAARLWMKWGVAPAAMVGHSIGEYVAACLSGVFSLADALHLVAIRGRVMQAQAPGGMLIVPLPETEVLPLMGSDLSLAAVNGPELCVVSGPHPALDTLANALKGRGIEGRQLHTSHAFHSAMMDSAIEPFRVAFGEITLNPPQIPFVSNLSGSWITPEQAMSPNYWTQHLRQTVRFSGNLQTLMTNPDKIFLEVGPGVTLTTLAKLQPGQARNPAIIASMRHPNDSQPDQATLLQALGRLWLAGVEPDWKGFYEGEKRRRIELPTYPFERRRCWIKPGAIGPHHRGIDDLASTKMPDLKDWFYLPVWKRAVRPELSDAANPGNPRLCWLVFGDECGLGGAIAEKLGAAGARIFLVRPGRKFAQAGENAYEISPGNAEDYARLLRDLARRDQRPTDVVHCWSVSAQAPNPSSPAFARSQELGFLSLLFLAQNLADPGGGERIQLRIIANQTQSVTGVDALSAQKATLLAAAKVIPQELQYVRCSCIDVELPPKGGSLDRLVGQVWSELQAAVFEPVIAWRGRTRWIPGFERAPLSEAPTGKTVLRPGGVYLITGGLGGIGLAIAKRLAHQFKAKLILTSRTGLPPRGDWTTILGKPAGDNRTRERIRQIQAIEAEGGEVLICAVDCADLAGMKTVIRDATARFGGINGVIHAAGILDLEAFKPISEMTRAVCDLNFQPKVEGLNVLETVLRGRDLDFCMVTSSTASVLGELASAYAAANQFMDTFVIQQNRGGGFPWISVNWDEWEVNDLALPNRKIGTFARKQSMTPSEGVAAFERLLTLIGEDQVVVSTGDLPARFARWIKLELSDEETTGPREGEETGTPGALKDILGPRNAVEEGLATIWQKLLGVPQVGMRDNFFELGGHSLSAVRLMAMIEQSFGKKLPLTTLYTRQTIEDLALAVAPEARESGVVHSIAGPPSALAAPLFCTPPAGGNTLIFRYLSARLAPGQRVVALEPPGLAANSQVLTTVEDTAAYYIGEIKRIQPLGPYHIFGWCAGSVAFETARQLEAQGTNVALLVIMESSPFFVATRGHTGAEGLVRSVNRHREAMAGLDLKGKSGYVGRRILGLIKFPFLIARRRYQSLGGRMYRAKGVEAPATLARGAQYEADIRAEGLYRPGRYPGHIVLFWASRDPNHSWYNPKDDWNSIAGGGVEHHFFDADRYQILSAANVAPLADKLREIISAVQTAGKDAAH